MYFCAAFCNIVWDTFALCDGELSKNKLNLE